MKTESTPPPSGVAAFLGEAGAGPEATTTVTITGTQKAVAKAIAGMAKKPGKKPGGAPEAKLPIGDEVPLPPEGGEGEELEVELEPEAPGGEGAPFPRGPRDEALTARAADIVEALIQEDPAASAK